MQPTILLVDDEKSSRSAVRRVLRGNDVRIVEVENGIEALAVSREQAIDLVLLDLRMPEMDGYTFLKQLRDHEKNRTLPVCIRSAWIDEAGKNRLIQLGADGYLEKTASNTELEAQVLALLRRGQYARRLERENRRLYTRLQERSQHLSAVLEELAEAWSISDLAEQEMLLRLAHLADLGSGESHGHTRRVGEYCALLAARAGWKDDEVARIRQAARLHDIGQIAVTASSGTAMQRRHPEIGARLLSGSDFPAVQLAGIIAHTHHEYYDGSGYPRGLAGEYIPEAGRIAAIADVFDELMVNCHNEAVLPIEEVFRHMRAEAGRRFDPRLLSLFLEDRGALLAIHCREGGGTAH